MKLKKLYLLLAAFVGFTACSDDDEVAVLDTSKVSQVEDFVDQRDGRTYKCVKIGDQIWMAENLAYYVEGGCLAGCYTWDEPFLDEAGLERLLVVDNATWVATLKQLADAPKYYYDMNIYYAYQDAKLAVERQGYTQEEAEDKYLKQYPEFYVEFKALVTPDRNPILKEHSDDAEAANGGYAEKNGYLYSLDAAKAACPEGWRVPSDEDWKKLEAALGMSADELDAMNAWRGGNVGDFLKIGGGSLFEVRFAGCNAWGYAKDVKFIRNGDAAYFWASDEKSYEITGEEVEDEESTDGTESETEETGPSVIREGIVRQLAVYSSAVWRGTTRLDNGYRGVAYSVRLVKDAN